MKIVVVGSSGRLGGTLFRHFKNLDFRVTGVDLHNAGTLRMRMEESDLAFLAVPAGEAMEMIEDYSSSQKIVELSSTKAPFKKYAGSIISIHPLFGPLSIGEERLRNILFITDISFPGSIEMISGLFPGFNVIPVGSEDHDRLMVELQVIPYLISMLSSRITTETRLKTRSRIKLEEVSGISTSQSVTTLLDTIKLNPFSVKAFETMRQAIEELRGEIFDSAPK
ncbi:MAG: hypothetical protein ACP5NK_02260 [Thermoplasmata archaeon]